MSEVFTVAIVGCGIGRSHIVEGYLNNQRGFRVLAVCDVNPERLNAVAEEFNIPRRALSLDEVLQMDDIDIVDICTPPWMHKDQILECLAAGKHVICEKPLVGSLKELEEVISAEQQSGKVLMPIFQYRYGNGVQRAKRIIESGIAGKPYVGTAETFWKRTNEYYEGTWHGKWDTELGGVLMTQGIHVHDLLTYLMGPPTAVFGRVTTRVNDIEVDDCVSATLELQSGAFASLTATLGAEEQISRLHLAFEHVEFESNHAPYSPGIDPWKIIPRSERAQKEIEDLMADWQDVPNRFAGQMRDFHTALVENLPMPVTTTDARQAIELVTAMYASAQTRQEQTLPLGPDHPMYGGWSPIMQGSLNVGRVR